MGEGKRCNNCGLKGRIGKDFPKNKDTEHNSFIFSYTGGHGYGRGCGYNNGRGRVHDHAARFKHAFLSAWKAREEYTKEDNIPNSGEMLANNANPKEEDTVEDKEEDLDTESEEAVSAIQARSAHIFASLNK